MLSIGIMVTPSIAADPDIEPEVETIFIETQENTAVYGDSILVVYNQPMLLNEQPYPLAGGMSDVNNVPGSEFEAPAEYPFNHGNATAKKSAKNYQVKITPGPYSNTQPYQGTWADLGGEAYYHPSDTNKRIILLKPPSKNSNFFAPGDRVEVTIANTVKNPKQKKMRLGKNKKKEIAS